MKHFYFFILAILTTNFALAQYTIADVTINGQDFKKITGIINANETLTNASLWILSGVVEVAPSTKLTITAGTQIFAEAAETSLKVNQLGEVDWQGTSTNPIVFNSLANAPGQGAGVNSPGQWTGIRIEGDGAGSNSGTIRYVRQMHAGFGNSTNSFRIENVGSGTTIEYIQVYNNANRAFRLNGGDVNVKYMISTNAQDIGFRFDDGWDGFGQFWVVNKNINAGNSIEGRGGNPTLSNVTVTGVGFNTNASPLGGGIRIRNQANAKIYNTIVTGVDRSMRFDDDSQQGIIDGNSFFRNSASFDNNVDGGTGFHSSASVFNPTNSDYDPSFNNSVVPFTIVDSYVGISTLNSTPAGAINSFFTDVNYVGAVEAGNDWTLDWTVDLDGNLRQTTLSVNEFEKTDIAIYPNPVLNNLIINSKIDLSSVAIYNILGKLVYENSSFNNQNSQIDMSQFQSGIYLLKVSSGNFSQTLKVIKK